MAGFTTANQIDPRHFDDSELSLHLLTARGLQWMFGCYGDDPYALILRAESDEPHTLHQQIRQRSALTHSRVGAWVTGRYELAAEVLNDPRLGARLAGGTVPEPVSFYAFEGLELSHLLTLDHQLIELERNDHNRLRGLTDPVLGPAGLLGRRAVLERNCQAVLGRIGPEFDLLADFARPLAVGAVADLAGLPNGKRELLGRLCADAAAAPDALLCPQQLETTRRLTSAVDGIRDLFATLIAARAVGTDDDLLSELSRAAASAGRQADEVLAAWMLTAVVGVDVTANLICNTTMALLEFPEQWDLLREAPALAPMAVEEALRFDPPVRLESRIAHEDVELAGQAVRAGEQVVVLVEAANRDPDSYRDPDSFDIGRQPEVPHLALTGGMNSAFVAPFARLQAEVAMRAVVDRFPNLRMAPAGVLRRLRSPVTRGVLRCPVVSA
ncbi:P450-derived glycosyltransferase activator [Amycolatopsis sp. cmx-11-12]|uniref:cytochrome P450 family protein n=1 Tax=Amycolatopsis sp. cmx-11-12 TaxID=2785795 RepID=UPI003917EE5C